MKQRPHTIVIIIIAVLAAVLAFAVDAASDDPSSGLGGLSVTAGQRATLLTELPVASATEHPWVRKGARTTVPAPLPATGEIESRLTHMMANIRLHKQSTIKPPPISDVQRAHVASLNLQDQPGGGVEVHFDGRNGTVSFLKFPKKATGKSVDEKAQKRNANLASSKALAQQTLHENRTLLKLNDPVEEMVLIKEEKDAVNHSHLRFQQTYRGVPIFGKQLLVHLDDAKNVYLINGRYEPSPSELSTAPGISSEAAMTAVYRHLGLGSTVLAEPESQLVIYAPEPGTATLAYKITIAPPINQKWIYFIDAHSGLFLHRINEIQNIVVAGSAPDLNNVNRTFNVWSSGSSFFLIDPTMPIADSASYDPVAALSASKSVGDSVIEDAQNSFDAKDFVRSTSPNKWDPVAVSAANNMKTAYQYYLKTFNRHAIDNKDGTMIAVVHVLFQEENGPDKNNATWNGTTMNYGDGDEVTFGPFAACLDVAAHEMTHGVTSHSAELVYENESGALNESFSDIFGAMVDRRNWLIGEN